MLEVHHVDDHPGQRVEAETWRAVWKPFCAPVACLLGKSSPDRHERLAGGITQKNRAAVHSTGSGRRLGDGAVELLFRHGAPDGLGNLQQPIELVGATFARLEGFLELSVGRLDRLGPLGELRPERFHVAGVAAGSCDDRQDQCQCQQESSPCGDPPDDALPFDNCRGRLTLALDESMRPQNREPVGRA